MNSYRSFGDWDIIRSLGEGGFGEVHHWKHRVTKQEIATKSLKPNGKLKPDEIAILKRRWLQEFNWMQSLKTPYIVSAINLPDKEFLSYLQDHNCWQALPVIVMEYCDGGDLRSRLERVEHLNGLHEQEIRDVLRTLRHAVEYLHVQCNIEHRDIKPENIVIHRSAKGNVYKLTDFGYAREIPESTIAQSVVGTRHYVAPEVIDPGSYTKTVDYWSVGVMVFELICGVRPFIPHKGFPIILTNVLKKPKNCIAITQKYENSQEADSYDFEEKIFPQNICSPIFIKKTEELLKQALDVDYKTRGSDGNTHKFYKDLDSILATNIISVFSLSSYQFYYYDGNAFKNVGEFFAKLSLDCGIEQNNMHLTLPTSHPKGSLRKITKPLDFFVAEWSDTSNAENPAAMLYVTDVTRGQCDCNIHREQTERNVSRTICTCLGIEKKKYDKVPIWLLEELERHVHSLLGNEQRYLECYLKGLYEFTITIEDEVFRFEDQIRRIYEETLILCGRVKQFECTVKKNAQTQNSQIWLERVQSCNKTCQLLKDEFVIKITTRHKSILRHCKDIASKDIFKTLPNEDIFKVNYFRKFLVEARGFKFSNSQRMSKCIELFDEWTNRMSKFPPMDLNAIHVEIVGQYELFRKIQENISGFAQYMEKFEKELESETENILQTLIKNDQQQLVSKMSSLHMDGNSLGAMSLSGSSTFSWTNGVCHVNGGCDDNCVLKLIEETNDIANNIRSVWGIEEDHVMCVDDTTVDIPTTINDI